MKSNSNESRAWFDWGAVQGKINSFAATKPYVTTRKNAGAVIVLVRRRVKEAKSAA